MGIANETKPFGRQVFLMFVGFFIVVIAVNVIFIRMALQTHTGVVVDKAYEKGLAFDTMAAKQNAQPDLVTKFHVADDTLVWRLKTQAGQTINAAKASGTLYRAVQDGYDRDVTLTPQGGGVYTAHINLPMKGKWGIRLKAIWDKQTYQTVKTFTIR